MSRREVDILVIGAGPAGIAAATAAAKHGSKVVVLDDNPALGGQIWRSGIEPSHPREPAGRAQAIDAFHAAGVEFLPGRQVVDAPEPQVLRTIVGHGTTTQTERFAWKKLIVCTGARERFLPFPGWTLPGVFGAGGLQALVKGGFPIEGKRVVVAGTGPLLLAVAVHLRQYGARVVCVAEQAPLRRLIPFAARLWSEPAKLLQGAGYRAALARVPYRTGCWPIAAEGGDWIQAVQLTDGCRRWTELCDLLACGFHLVPNTELAALLECRFSGDFVAVDEQQQTSIANVFCAGEPAGIAGLEAAQIQGEIAGLAAAGVLEQTPSLRRRQRHAILFARRFDSAFRLRDELRSLAQADTIVCRCEDVRFAQLQKQASWTEAKLQTRCGMGPCQGRVCGPALQTLFGWRAPSVRPPLFPVPVSAFCGYSLSESAQNAARTQDLQEIQ